MHSTPLPPSALPFVLALVAGWALPACASPDTGPGPAPAVARGPATDPAPPAPAPAPGPAAAPVADAAAAPVVPPARDWMSTDGTTTLGFGILRLAPRPGAASARFRVTFEDEGDGGYASDATSACVFLLPGDAFADGPSAYADAWLAFDRAAGDGYGAVRAATEVEVDGDRVVLVAYGPWDGADVGRPPSTDHTFTLTVEPLDGGRYRWIESEAGEMVTTAWTAHDEVARGGPVTDPLTGEAIWIETRVLVLYDAGVARPASEADGDPQRIPLPDDVHAVLARVPIRWR